MQKFTGYPVKPTRIQQSYDVTFSNHCWERMALRDASESDIYCALKSGNILKTEWDSKYKNWKYRVRGIDAIGEILNVVVAKCEMSKSIHFVTVF